MNITTAAADLAKNLITVCAQDASGRTVAVKNVEQQARLARHRMREGWKEERTALGNRIRGLLAEFGVVIPKSQAGGIPEDPHCHRQQERASAVGFARA